MSTISTERLYGEITGSTATLAGLIDGADLTRPVPTCPEGHDDTVKLLSTVSVGGRASARASAAPGPSGGGCCGGACGCG